MTKTVVHTDRAPAPFGGAPYSQAITAGGLVYTAGQVGFDAEGNLHGDIAEQTRRTFDNVAAILEAAGSGLDRIVKTTVFMSDLEEFAAMNAVYAERMPSPFPARSTVQVAKLPGGAKVEIEVVALA